MIYPHGAPDPLDDAELDRDFPLGDGVADTEVRVECPCCGERVVVGLDPGSGSHQAYVEDCEVCCRPWQVHVDYDASGHARVRVEPADAE